MNPTGSVALGATKIKYSQCFVLMPFGEAWSRRIWDKYIKVIIDGFGMEAVRADDLYGNNILSDIWRGIAESRIIIADITGRNPNVLYELGAAHALQKDVVILAQREEDIPFDLRTYRCLIYEDNSDGYESLEKRIPKFLREILFSDLADNFGNRIGSDEILLLYMSEGGTCRCAMANVITRHFLKIGKGRGPVMPMSAGRLDQLSDCMSLEAQQVIGEHLDVDVHDHKRISVTFPLLARATVILPMTGKLLESLPEGIRGKAKLFSSFFGASGEVDDPYNRGIDVYRACYEQLEEIIKGNIDAILSLGRSDQRSLAT